MRSYLIVDVGGSLADQLTRLFGDSARIEAARRAEHALELAREQRFDAAVIDIRAGLLLLSRLRGIAPGLPAILVSADASDPVAIEISRQGVMAVVGEPVDVLRVAKVLRRARAHGIVALVEDDAAFGENLAEALNESGFSPVMARSVSEIRSLVLAKPFAGVVDVRVPGGSDGEALRRLAAQHPRMPLIAMSGYDDALYKQTAQRHLLKPFRTADLLAALEEFHEAQRL